MFQAPKYSINNQSETFKNHKSDHKNDANMVEQTKVSKEYLNMFYNESKSSL